MLDRITVSKPEPPLWPAPTRHGGGVAASQDRLIWIVDPETGHRESIVWAAGACLRQVAFEGLSSQTAALERLAGSPPQPAIIITDFRGDLRINGAEFIAQARSRCRPETRFVMFSALVEDAAAFRRLAGQQYDLPNAIVPKPDVFKLARALAELLPPLPWDNRANE